MSRVDLMNFFLFLISYGFFSLLGLIIMCFGFGWEFCRIDHDRKQLLKKKIDFLVEFKAKK